MSHKLPSSAPVSPVATRSRNHSSKINDRYNILPVTPQRLSRGTTAHHLRPSPVTPASNTSDPYTPPSSRSYASSNGSTPATPSLSASSVKRLHFVLSPELNASVTKNKDKSLADIAQNWRMRANENGIKVSPAVEDSHYADDEGSCARPE
jgi:hypothetical protein